MTAEEIYKKAIAQYGVEPQRKNGYRGDGRIDKRSNEVRSRTQYC